MHRIIVQSTLKLFALVSLLGLTGCWEVIDDFNVMNATKTPNNDFALAVVVQSDGKYIAVGGSQGADNKGNMALVRYHTDGTLDTEFGTSGKVNFTVGSNGVIGSAATLQTNGKVVVGGMNNFNGALEMIMVVRFETSGALDTSFNTLGYNILDTSGGGFESVRMDGQGRIVLGAESSDFVVARLLADGSGLDTSFNTIGYNSTDFFSDNKGDNSTVITLLPDERIVAVGTSSAQDTTGNFAVAQYRSNGALDTSFATRGYVTTKMVTGALDIARTVVAQTDGKIVALGFARIGSIDHFAMARYQTNGALDDTFGTAGKVLTSFGTFNASIRSAILQESGKIIAVGYGRASSGSNLILVRYNTDGTIDTGWGENGITMTSIGTHAFAFSSMLTKKGTILVGGQTFTMGNPSSPGSATTDFVLAEYWP